MHFRSHSILTNKLNVLGANYSNHIFKCVIRYSIYMSKALLRYTYVNTTLRHTASVTFISTIKFDVQ